MKRIALAVAALSIVGCTQVVYPDTTTTEPTDTTVETTTTNPPTTTKPPTTTTTYEPSERVREAAFVAVMRDESAQLRAVTWVDVVDDDYLIEWGHLFCNIVREANSWADATLMVQDIGKSSFEEGWVEDDNTMVAIGSGAAIGAFCPEFEDMVGRS